MRKDVLEATFQELAESGYHGLTIDVVARRAGVHKTTVYRRWSSVEGLLADALLETAQQGWDIPDTGTLEDDLTALNLEVLHANRQMLTAVIGAAFQAGSAREALSGFYQRRFDQAAIVVERAKQRGEVPAGTSPVELVRAACAPIYFRLFIAGEEVSEEDARTAAKVAIAAARQGVL